MARFITVIIAMLLITVLGLVVLCGFLLEISSLTNSNIQDSDDEYYKRRVKLYAIPYNDEDGIIDYENITNDTWLEIKQKMLNHRTKIEELEMRNMKMEATIIVLYFIAFFSLMTYSPALWASRYRFGNECEKVIFHLYIGILLIPGLILRITSYCIVKQHYREIAKIAANEIFEVSGVKLKDPIHYCYYDFSFHRNYKDLGNQDWHQLSPKTHPELDKIAKEKIYCHPETLHIYILFFCSLAVASHIILFGITQRLTYSQKDLLDEMDNIENRPFQLAEDDDSIPEVIIKPNERNQKFMFHENYKNDEYDGGDYDAVIEKLLESGQLDELRKIYLGTLPSKKSSPSILSLKTKK